MDTLNLYLDDSGTRHPKKKPGKTAAHGYDWFALGGVLINDSDEDRARAMHNAFVKSWPQVNSPLHSSEIRSQNESFFWLRDLEKSESNRFHEELYSLMRDAPVTGIACVIDRPGYVGRYLEKYQENPWMLCKTAFTVVVERAVKYARSRGQKLRVFPERSNKPEDRRLESYYAALKAEGMPFARENSEKYAPLTQAEFAESLYEFAKKAKTSAMIQFADLYLWPICMGGYHHSNRPYKRLLEDKKLIECQIPEKDWQMLACKYSCFENVESKP